MTIAAFLEKLRKLRVDRSKGTPAPHKSVLLLAVLKAMDDGDIWENKVFISAELVARFRDIWHEFVGDDRFVSNFSLPFYHLKSDGFWRLNTLPGREIVLSVSHSIKSFQSLKSAVAYACFDEQVFPLLCNAQNREFIRQELQQRYLGGQQTNSIGYDLFETVTAQILNEPAVAYRKAVAAADEEELFIRGGVFKKVVPRIYNYTCCITGMKITAARDLQMIDACHIVPFAENHDDTITNGLSLSPNFHRAFDRFLITIDSDYKVVVSEHFTETGGHSIREFNGRKILLPNEAKYYPAADNLQWHWERFMGT